MADTNNDTLFRNKSADEIASSIKDEILTNTDKINDFTEGSALGTLVDAFSTELEMYYQLGVDNIESSIDESIYKSFKFQRVLERKAYGTVLVNFSNTLASPVTIARGTKFNSTIPSYTQEYVTLQDYIVPAGTLAYPVTAYCTQGGTFGNIPAGVINNVTNLASVYTVTNPMSISTGTDEEPLDITRQRFRRFIQALQRGTVQAVKYGAESLVGPSGGVNIDEEIGYVKVFCHDANGDLPTDLQQKLQSNMINWRPAGIPVEIFPTHKSVVDINIAIDVPNVNLQTTALQQAVIQSVTNYIDNKNAGQNLVHSEIIRNILNTDELGIKNARADIMVTPDNGLRSQLQVTTDDSIIINEHKVNRKYLIPKDNSKVEGYIHNPDDYDNPDHIFPSQADTLNSFNISTNKNNLFLVNENKSVVNENSQFLVNESNSAVNENNQILANENNSVVSENNQFSVNGNKSVEVTTGITNTAANYFIYTCSADGFGDLQDNSIYKVVLDSNNKNISSFTFTGSDNTTITMYNSSNGVLLSADVTDSKGKTIQIPLVNDVPSTFGVWSFSESNTMFSITNTVTGQAISLLKGSMTINSYISAINQTTINFTNLPKLNINNVANTQDTTKLLDVTLIYDNNTRETSYNCAGVNLGYTLTTIGIDLSKTVIVYTGNGTLVSKTVYDKNGNEISSVDSNGNNLMPSTTTTSTTSTTYNPSKIPDTSTTTTIQQYPFKDIPEVSAGDAPLNGYVAVLNAYVTQSNEVLRSGIINVVFNTSSVNN